MIPSQPGFQLPERDWQYLRRIQDELLQKLCERANQQSAAILDHADLSPHEITSRLSRHVQDTDNIIADCFDDWRRSTLVPKLLMLRRHHLLTDDHLEHLSEQSQDVIGELPAQ